jgi:L-glutamine:2-deoxy-scyllo-inosose/3-amino-2,3-dideoxy-scyllo-inosose aminotransferase
MSKDLKHNAGELALCGGEPVAREALAAPPWPPVDEATARQLADLYLSRNWSFNGPQEQAFCEEYAAAHDAAFGVFMANGTVTLQCALEAYGIGAGDEVIMPALTWPATAMAALYVDATPVFADIEPSTLCLDPQAFEAAITPRTRAVIPVHLYGGMADLDAILAIAKKHDLSVIEDCAHGQGGKWNGRGLGSWGDVGSFSFQQSKTVASGEGGICLTNDAATADRLYRAKHIGYGSGSAQGQAAAGPPPGLLCHNFRATDFQALILRSQLRHLDELIATYNDNAAYLEEQLRDVPGVRVQARGRLSGPQSYYAFGLIFDEEPLRDIPLEVIQRAINAEGLGVGGTYGVVYRHILWNIEPGRYRIESDGCPVSTEIGAGRTLVLPHQWLGAPQSTLDAAGAILRKVACRHDALREVTP